MPTAAVSSNRTRNRLVNEINVVPYIDVMLVLLVIFMVTAPLIPTGQINVPSAGRSPDPVPATGYVEVAIGKDGAIKVTPRSLPGKKGERAVSGAKALLEEVRGLTDSNVNVPLVIRADESVIYKSVIETFTDLQQGGFRKVGFMVKPSN